MDLQSTQSNGPNTKKDGYMGYYVGYFGGPGAINMMDSTVVLGRTWVSIQGLCHGPYSSPCQGSMSLWLTRNMTVAHI